MKRLVSLLAVVLAVVACASAGQREKDLVSRAVRAMGGVDALAGIKTLSIKGTVRRWEPEQSMVAGGDMRLACDSTFESVTDTAWGVTRVDWVRNFSYPATRTYTFTEIVAVDAGYVAGIDATARTKQSLDSNPPAHAMSGVRLAATQRELRRSSPTLLLDMLKSPTRVASAGSETIGSVAYPAVTYRAGEEIFTVMFDAQTGLPARIRTLDYDNIWGDVTYDLALSDWRTMDGLRVATTRKYELNGRPVAEIKITDVKVNAPVAPERLAIPAAFKSGAPGPASGRVPYQWVLRRQFIGTYLDSENPSFDTRAGAGLRLVELGPGVQHVVGGTHNSMIVEMRDYLIVFDAPITDWQSNWVLKAALDKFSGKPVKYLVLTHHHMDHAGGFRAYAATGATIIVGKGNGEHFRRALAAPSTRNPDLVARNLSRTPVMEVADKYSLTDGTREVQVIVVENPHAAGMVIGYVVDQRLGFVTDLWSPGRDPLPATITPEQAALVNGVKKAGISPQRFAGGHGATGDYAPLAALAAK